MRPSLACLLVGSALTGCEPAGPAAEPDERPPDIALRTVVLRQYRGSDTALVARTPQLAFHRGGPHAGQLVASAVTVDSRAGLHVDAQTVQGDALNGRLEGLTVRATSADGGTTYESPRALFDQALGPSGTAWTDAGVVVHHPSFDLHAGAARMDIAEEAADLRDISMTLR